MKLILATDDQEKFAAVWNLLHEAGIPAREPSKYSDMPGYRVGPNVRELYLWLDHQYDEAVKLLNDPHYLVKNPVDWDEFDQVQRDVREEFEGRREHLHEKVLNIAIIVVVLGGHCVRRLSNLVCKVKPGSFELGQATNHLI